MDKSSDKKTPSDSVTNFSRLRSLLSPRRRIPQQSPTLPEFQSSSSKKTWRESISGFPVLRSILRSRPIALQPTAALSLILDHSNENRQTASYPADIIPMSHMNFPESVQHAHELVPLSEFLQNPLDTNQTHYQSRDQQSNQPRALNQPTTTPPSLQNFSEPMLHSQQYTTFSEYSHQPLNVNQPDQLSFPLIDADHDSLDSIEPTLTITPTSMLKMTKDLIDSPPFPCKTHSESETLPGHILEIINSVERPIQTGSEMDWSEANTSTQSFQPTAHFEPCLFPSITEIFPASRNQELRTKSVSPSKKYGMGRKGNKSNLFPQNQGVANMDRLNKQFCFDPADTSKLSPIEEVQCCESQNLDIIPASKRFGQPGLTEPPSHRSSYSGMLPKIAEDESQSAYRTNSPRRTQPLRRPLILLSHQTGGGSNRTDSDGLKQEDCAEDNSARTSQLTPFYHEIKTYALSAVLEPLIEEEEKQEIRDEMQKGEDAE